MPEARTASHGGKPARGLWSWALFDWANSGFFTLIQTFVFAAYFTRSVAADQTVGTAQWGNMLGAAGLVIGLGGPVLGAVADRCGRRKPWIAAFSALNIAATALLFLVRPDPGWTLFALVCAGLGTVGAEYASIFYNAMLPDLAPPERLGRWSGWGWGLGYAGGLLALILSLYGFVLPPAFFGVSQAAACNVRAVCLLSAAWYLVFSLPFFARTPDAPATGLGLPAAARQGLRQLRESLRRVRRSRSIALFLLARMVYNDALATMFAFGGIYAAGTFGLGPAEVIAFGIGLNVTAGLGCLVFGWVDDALGSRRTILVSLAALTGLGLVMLLTTSLAWFWGCGLGLGVFVGPVQASSRTWLARVAPEERRNEMFGLFALSGKVTSFAGPLLVGWLTWISGSQRVGMGAVIALFAAGLLLMLPVPRAAVARAEAAQGAGAEREEGPGAGL
ncbi:MAG: MFS transporter [Desulfovibrionaceae bacterium]